MPTAGGEGDFVPPDGVRAPGRWRRWAIVAAAAALVTAHLYDVATGREHWPVSNYPMYSTVKGDQHEVWRLYGIVAEPFGSVRSDVEVSPYDGRMEFELASGRFVPPVNATRLRNAIDDLMRRSGRHYDPPAAKRIIADYLSVYEGRRTRGLHDGPPLSGVRLYRVARPIVSYAANVDEVAPREMKQEILVGPTTPLSSGGGL